MPKKYYKVVFLLENQSKVSLVYKDLPPNARVVYKLGKWTTPKIAGSKLFVFDSLQFAKYSIDSRHEIYECEIKDMEKISTRLAINTGLHATNIRMFWKNALSSDYNVPVPSGTVAASAVKLVKKVFPANQEW